MSEFILVAGAFAGGAFAQKYLDVIGKVYAFVFPPPKPPDPTAALTAAALQGILNRLDELAAKK